MITKRTFVDQLTVLEDGQLQIREATQFEENGTPVSEKSYRRYVRVPGDDLAGEDELVRDVGNNLHTPARIANFQAQRNARQQGRGNS